MNNQFVEEFYQYLEKTVNPLKQQFKMSKNEEIRHRVKKMANDIENYIDKANHFLLEDYNELAKNEYRKVRVTVRAINSLLNLLEDDTI